MTRLETQYIKARRAGTRLDPVPGFPITTDYHVRGSEWSLGYHTGEDRQCPVGTKVVAVTWGHVIGVGWGGSPHALGADYGNVVLIEKHSGDLEYFYAHLSRFEVRLGQAVMPGMVVGYSGSTGNVTGPHVHVEARPLNGSFGTDVDPIRVEQEH